MRILSVGKRTFLLKAQNAKSKVQKLFYIFALHFTFDRAKQRNVDIKSFISAIAQIAEEKGIPYEKVIESIETAIAAAYKKEYGKKGQIIKTKLNPETGEAKFWQVMLVVDESMILTEEELESMKEKPSFTNATEGKEEDLSAEALAKAEKVRFNTEKHIMLEEAQKINKDLKPGDELEIPLATKEDYGRIAAQTAKQVILQKIREAERETVLSEYKQKEGEIVSGIVQRIEAGNVFFDIGKTVGVLPREEQVPGEFYRPGQRLRVYVLKVEDASKGPMVFLSRAYPKIISKLFEIEVPEIAQGQVQIKSVAREAGSRSKVAVVSISENIDPIGSMVGQRGIRVSSVINELGGEKIDIIEWSEDPEKFIANSLSPAKVLEVKIRERNTALAIVPEDQLSLAIGRDGQNVRLAVKLTGWKIDVRSPEKETEAKVEEEKPEAEKKENLEEKRKESRGKPAKKTKSKKTKEAEKKKESLKKNSKESQ